MNKLRALWAIIRGHSVAYRYIVDSSGLIGMESHCHAYECNFKGVGMWNQFTHSGTGRTVL